MKAREWNTWAVRHGEAWRLITSNLIHFDARHLAFDLVSFVIAGWLSERYFPRSYGCLILWLALGVGVAAVCCVDHHTRARGLSGVNAGMYAALLWAEIARARHEPSRWWLVSASTVLYVAWLCYGAFTGRSLLAGGD